MIQIFKQLWKNIFHFKGRTGREEFFLSILANFIGMCIGCIPFLLVYTAVLLIINRFGSGMTFEDIMIFGLITSGIYCGIFMLPMISLLVRRIRDSGISWWVAAALIIILPAIGYLIVGSMQKTPRKHCIASNIGYTLLACGFGLPLWGMSIFAITQDMSAFEILGSIGIFVMPIGLGIAYIGTKIDDKINEDETDEDERKA